MMAEFPVLKPRQVIRALEKAGFETRRQTGSHVILYKPGLCRPISIPLHTQDMPAGTLRAIVRQAGLSIKEFTSLL
jgi:predicted RNA binding protein YcfA (HicA-like mRNA interferase family)